MEEDEETLCRFGTALDPLDEDDMPSKKPIAIEDQIVKDINGKRRFHGAFTGGFAAGFWNTVGSQEGWTPKEFKSSRAEKSGTKSQQRPEDFMDDEDLGEFGIAPQRIQTTEDFSSKSDKGHKRKFEKRHDGPIPGIPVLQTLLEPAKDNVAIRLLKKMGWREGQGVGARLTRKQKKVAKERNEKEIYLAKKYGCAFEEKHENLVSADSDESDFSDTEITFAPDDYTPLVVGLKDNFFGLGYSGLNRDPILKNQHINLFSAFEVLDRNNKKFSIAGQAFGVGALEEEDEDIYARDDMTRYDFTLDNRKKKIKKIEAIANSNVIEGFVPPKSETNIKMTKETFIIQIPSNFKPRNWATRRTRFEPLDESVAKEIQKRDSYKAVGLGRHDLKPNDRGNILNENKKQDEAPKKSKQPPNIWDLINSKQFTKGDVLNDNQNAEHEKNKLEAFKITQDLDTSSGTFRPFASNVSKQERYEKFIDFKESANQNLDQFLNSIQPMNLSEFEREMEKKEFFQAKKLYKPLKGLMMDRFVTESEVVLQEKVKEIQKADGVKIIVKRTKVSWKPHSQLCKRFNVPDPSGGIPSEPKHKKTSKYSIFDYLENNLNDKKDFVTPIIIPSKQDKEITSKPDEHQTRSTSSSKEELKVDKIVPQPSTSNVTAYVPKTVVAKPRPDKKKVSENKTELEKKVEETRNVHPSEKKDLFRAIFESSDEEDDDKAEKNSDSQSDIVILDNQRNIMDSILLKSASEINILRNNSPPRGIFASLFAIKDKAIPKTEEIKHNEIGDAKQESIPSEVLNKQDLGTTSKSGAVHQIKFRSKEQRNKEEEEEHKEKVEEVSFYGPQPPPCVNISLISSSSKSNDDHLDNRLEKLLKTTKIKEKVIEEWVEKYKKSSKKKKKEKDKKHKKKHKKEKKSKK